MTNLKPKLQAKWIVDRTEGIGPKLVRGPLDRCRLSLRIATFPFSVDIFFCIGSVL